MEQSQSEALRKIQVLEFTAIELNLFLDTHPEDKNAVDIYNLATRELNKSKKAYEKMYGPLVNFGFSRSKSPWQWISSPWPWEV
ncbi:spore coat protein CotJB [Candidatus Formimonas warabiya]|uniref:Spore coat protein CotJB n=1 Tax=Formimonas warabiya TaxID=1761012 RepID=A0A3G1KWP8_FORW1|nr:spore coat protein CotJB [Candidatus Formimonas warabiya]ATW26861.1 spore coat protein CotJB [Candidatus Formimonas warabiya]